MLISAGQGRHHVPLLVVDTCLPDGLDAFKTGDNVAKLLVITKHQRGGGLLDENACNDMKLGLKLFPVVPVFNEDKAGTDQGNSQCAGE